MATTKPSKASTCAIPPAPRSQGYITLPSYPINPDVIEDVLGLCLIWALPAFFFAGIIVLGTMLISHTLVMRIPLPRRFTLVIVIVFAGLLTITFFLLVAFHIRRCQLRITLQQVRFELSETSAVDENIHGSRSSSHSSQSSQGAVLNVGSVAPTASEQEPGAIPLRRVRSYAGIKQAAQGQDDLGGMGSVHGSTHSPRRSSNSSLETHTIHDEQWPLRPSLQRRPSPLIIPSSSFGNAPPTVPFLPSQPEEVVYYLPPGPPSPLPEGGFRPMWATDQMGSNVKASETGKPGKGWWFKWRSLWGLRFLK